MAREAQQDRARAGLILKTMREEEGLTQKQVVEIICSTAGPTISIRHLRRIENGYITPSVTLGLKICAAVGISPFDVWGCS